MARGSVQKKGSNYYIRYRFNGKQISKAVGAGATKRQAEKMLTEIMGQIHNGGYRELEDTTFGEFSEKWLSDYAEPRVKASTYKFYKDIIDNHLAPKSSDRLPGFGDFYLSSITTHMIEEYLATKKRETDLSPTTIGYLLVVMKMILKRAIAWGYLSKNPAEYIEKPRKETKEMDFLNIEELRQFTETAKQTDPDYYPLFLTACLTGMRRGELLALKWSDINWAISQIHVRRSLVLGEIETPKSKAAVRAVIVPPILISVLKKHQLSCPIGELNLVFPNREGKIMHAENMIRRHYLPALRRSGLRRIRFHDLRHTYASLLIAQSENLKFIQQQLGHSSAQVTLDRYGHLMPQVQHGVGERLQENVFGDYVGRMWEESDLQKENKPSPRNISIPNS